MKHFYIIFSVVILFGLSCKKESDSTSPPKNNNTPNEKEGTLRVYLTDSRGDYKAVYIDVEEMEVLWSDGSQGGWTPISNFNPGMYDLLKLSNGTDTLLGLMNLPASEISQIRLILGQRNFVVLKADNDSIAMATPSAQQSGLKIKTNDSIKAGINYDLIIDFDAGKSVVKAGKSGKYILKPVIRTISQANSGSIKGQVSPSSFSTAAMAIQGTDTFGTYTDSNGDFLIRGLVSGTYDVYLDPGSGSGYSDTLITGNSVTNGFVLDLGSIQLK